LKKVYLFLADGFEEVEALAVVDMLRRVGINVVTVSIMGNEIVTGSHSIRVISDTVFESSDWSQGDMLILPGGGIGAKNLSEHEGLGTLLVRYAKEDKWLAAICAAPGVLGKYGLLAGKQATCYPGHEDKMTGATPVVIPAIVDGKIITGRGMGSTLDFALKIVEMLESKEAADKLKEQILYKN